MLRRLRHYDQDDSGFVLITVILIAAVLAATLSIALVSSVTQVQQSRRDQDHNAALQAAEAGIDEYVARLSSDTNYWQRENVDVGNAAFTAFTTVPGSAGTAQFTYKVDISDAISGGILRLTSTGKVGDQKRTVRVNLNRENFTDYIYFSDLEVNDPTNFTKYVSASDQGAVAAARRDKCQRYAWVDSTTAVLGNDSFQVRGNSSAAPACSVPAWSSYDTVDGAFHTNDLPKINGGTFKGKTEAGCSNPCGTNGLNYVSNAGNTDVPVFQAGGVQANGYKGLPKSNTKIRDQAQSPNAGCLYTGPTRIVLHDDTYDVYSANSNNTNGGTCALTGALGSGNRHALNVPLPANGVIYIQDVPTNTNDVNYPSWTIPCTAPFVAGPKPAKSLSTYITNPSSTPVQYATTPNGFPLPGDKNTYDCRKGDVFIEGRLKGKLTVGTQNNIIVTGDTTYKDSTQDLLGLVASETIWLYHPVNRANTQTGVYLQGKQYDMCTTPCMANLEIDASLMSINHGLGFQYPDVGGNYGTLKIVGSLAQKWRNNVGGGDPAAATSALGSSTHQGYAKNYIYDDKLKYSQPPSFLSPDVTQWGVASWSELPVSDLNG